MHEFGHLLGFADLYNESGSTTDLPYTVMGGWYYSTPASLPDPFSRIAARWGNVTQVAGPGTFTLRASGTHGEVLKVGDGDEFFLVDLRRNTDAYDGDLEVDRGVFVERVQLDKRPSPAPGNYLNTLQNCVDCTAFDPMLMVEEADGRYDLQLGRPRNDAADLFHDGDSVGPSDDTQPRTTTRPVFSTNRLSGAPTGITITVIAVSDDEATVEVDAPVVADPCAAVVDFCDGACSVNDDEGHGVCGDFVAFPAAVDNRDGDVDVDGADVDSCGGCAGGDELADVGGCATLVVLLRRRRPTSCR